MSMCPGACVIINGTLPCIAAAIGVTPQAQKTGVSSSLTSTLSPKSTLFISSMPITAGSPQCIGSPCTWGNYAVICFTSSTRWVGMGLMETTIGPEKIPCGVVCMFVRYIATFFFWSICLSGIPAFIIASSKLKEHPRTKPTNPSSHRSSISSLCSISSPFL